MTRVHPRSPWIRTPLDGRHYDRTLSSIPRLLTSQSSRVRLDDVKNTSYWSDNESAFPNLEAAGLGRAVALTSNEPCKRYD